MALGRFWIESKVDHALFSSLAPRVPEIQDVGKLAVWGGDMSCVLSNLCYSGKMEINFNLISYRVDRLSLASVSRGAVAAGS